jgi:uncharacterized lipoprotein YmbA
MRRRRLVATLTLVGLGPLALAGSGLLALAGCVSFKRTPGARFFVLRSLVEPKTAEAAAPPVEGFVGLLPVRIPGALDRPQLVTWTAPNELRLDEFLRWAEPLDEGATRTLAEDLAALLPRDRILRAPWPAAASPRCRVATELRVFGLQPNGEVRLEAGFVLLAPKEERVLARRSFASSRPPAAGARAASPGASVDAMSELLADLAKQIAQAIESLPVEASASPATPAP